MYFLFVFVFYFFAKHSDTITRTKWIQKNGVSNVASFEQHYELSKFKNRNSKRLQRLSIKILLILQGKIILQRGKWNNIIIWTIMSTLIFNLKLCWWVFTVTFTLTWSSNLQLALEYQLSVVVWYLKINIVENLTPFQYTFLLYINKVDHQLNWNYHQTVVILGCRRSGHQTIIL